jgi:murein DD-endopeptidase MepM/ murein hydrolase activator NlpD
MIRAGLIIVLLLSLTNLSSQTRTELEEQRSKTLEEIAYMDNLLKETGAEKKESMGQLNVISRKLVLRERVILGIGEEMRLLETRIELNRLAVLLMEDDLETLIKDYERAILNAQRFSKGQPELAYIFSSKDLNQGYKRIKYLQQVAKYRRKESELIFEIKEQVERNKSKLEDDFDDVNILRQREVKQKTKLQGEKNNKSRLITSLGQKERQLRKELRQKQLIAERIEKEIERIIEEERKRRSLTEMTPEEKLVGDDFSRNIGKLPWPVDRGVITSQFGVHEHPVFEGTQVDNIGVEISSSQRVRARAVFMGKVMSVFGISGGNMAVIIRHGRYLTVYQNLVSVTVRPGDIIETKQVLGDVFNDAEEGGKSIMKFMVYEEKNKQDPEIWLAKKH